MLQFGINFARATIQVIATAISSAWNSINLSWNNINSDWDDLD